MKLTLRDSSKTNCTELARLFYDTVHPVNAGDSSREQLDGHIVGLIL